MIEPSICRPPRAIWPPARLAVARDRQRHFLRDALWLSVAPVAEGPSALEHGLSLVCSLALMPACSRRSTMRQVITDRERVGREASPAGRDHRQPEHQDPRRLAARAVMMPARRSAGAKRHALVDTDGRGLLDRAAPGQHSGSRRGRAAPAKPPAACFLSSSGSLLMADSVGERVATMTRIIVEIVAKSPDQIGFGCFAAPMGGRAVLCLDRPQQKGLPKISRPASTPPGAFLTPLIAALTPHRKARMSFDACQDFEASIDSARAFLYAASVMLLTRRIARHA